MKLFRYNLKYDLQGIKVYLIIVYIINIMITILPLYSINVFPIAFDLILPIEVEIAISLIFAKDFNSNNREFIRTFPISTIELIVLRYLRILLILLPSYIFLFFYDIPYNLFEFIIKYVPSNFYISTLTLFLIVLTYNQYFTNIIVLGLLFFDYFTLGKILGLFTILPNVYHELNNTMYIINRLLFLGISIVMILLTVIKYKMKPKL